MESMLDKKLIWVVFLFEFTMGHKAVETTHNINSVFGPRTANECIVQWWFKKFYRGDESLGDKEHSDWPSEVDDDQLRGSWKLILLQLHEKFPKNSVLTTLQLFGIGSKLERWKSLISGCLIGWLQIKKKKINVLKCHLLLFYSTTISQSDCDVWWKVNFVWQLTMISSVLRLRRSSKALPKAKFPPKKVHCLVFCCLSDPLQLSESQWRFLFKY